MAHGDVLLDDALQALDDCDEVLKELQRTCCQPKRSPRMKALADTLALARGDLTRLHGNLGAVDDALAQLEDAGAQIGSLQVGCCLPRRMPLYGEMLMGLSEAQRTIKRSVGRSLHH